MGGSTKQALLQALSAAEGAYISGQQLAEALGVSRAAVHKAAQALLAQGYALDSAPRRGYRLAGGDPFCTEAVGPYPAPIHIYDTLQSSNLTAKQLALGGVPPYGYTAKPVTHGGHPTTMLEVQPEEAQQVQAFYTGYGVAGQNVEQLVQAANQAGSRTRQGARWSNSAVLRLLRSPVYVQGDLSCAVFLQRQGAVLTHALEAYCCGNGYLVYGSPSRRQGSKLVHLEGEHVAAGLHRGIIDGTLWRSVQERLNARGGSTNRGTGHTSWLQGLAVCGLCGTRCYARSNGKGAAYTYFVCRGKRQGICTGIAGLRTETVEQAVAPVLAEQAAAVLPYAQAAKPEPSAAAVALEKLEQRMRRLAA